MPDRVDNRPHDVRALAVRLALVIAIIAAITAVCLRPLHVNATTAGFAYLVAILFISARWGLTEAIIGSIAAVLCFNFFFLPPIGTFTIADPQNWIAFFFFLATSFTASQLSAQVKQRALEATERQREMEKLYALSRSILLIEPVRGVARQLAGHLAQVCGASAVALYDRESGETFSAGPEDFPEPADLLHQAALEGTFFRNEQAHTVVTSIRLGAQPIGSLGLRDADLSDSALQGVANLVAIGLERARAQEAASKAEAARQSDELKSTLLDAVAHEFKTPLTSIKAASTALLSGSVPQPEQQHDLIAIVDQEADRLSALVTEAIQMARIEAGRVHLRRDSYPVGDLVELVLNKMRPSLEERNIQVRIAPQVPAVWVDSELIEVALRQLVDNALKYSPADTPILIGAELADGRVIVRVADHGPGIPEQEQTRIFEKFYRVETTRQIPGAGLGLAIAREIVHAHGGEIWVESKVGEGSIFRFSLPVSPERRGSSHTAPSEQTVNDVAAGSAPIIK
ncbi:MAG TPA: ATP-binding protein [Bryobacteraceae bacterium]|nr:ATP-binding protein [Bryobacteraceae bacterium]